MTTPLTCPVCGLEIAIDQQSAEIALEYSVPKWKAQCTSQLGDGPALCVNMRPLILELVGRQNGNGNGRGIDC